MAAAPTSLDVLATRIETGRFFCAGIVAAESGGEFLGIGREIAAAAPLGMAQHREEPAGDIDKVLVALGGFLQDRQAPVCWRWPHHPGECRHLAELHRVDVFEGVEIDDHAALALRDLAIDNSAPIA